MLAGFLKMQIAEEGGEPNRLDVSITRVCFQYTFEKHSIDRSLSITCISLFRCFPKRTAGVQSKAKNIL